MDYFADENKLAFFSLQQNNYFITFDVWVVRAWHKTP